MVQVTSDVERELVRFSNAAEDYIRPDTYPIAVKMVKDEGDIPQDAVRPLKDFGHRVSVCQAFSIATGWGSSLAVLAEDQYCPLAQIKFGFAKNVEFYSDGNVALGYFAKDLEAGKKCEEALYGFEYGTYIGLVVAPLSIANFEPDLVIVFGNAVRMQFLINACLWCRGGSLETSLTARAACTQVVPKIMLTGECGLAIPCYGGREWAMIGENTLLFSIPMSKLPDVSDGLEGGAEAGASLVSHLNLSWEAGEFYPYDKMWELMGKPCPKEIMEQQRSVRIPRKRK